MKRIVVMLIVVASAASMSYGVGCPFSKCGVGKKAATPKAEVKKASVVDVCTGCGEIKGSAKCCKADAKKCGGCGMNKSSVGCCKNLKPAEGEKTIKLCAACGEVKGSNNCCKANAKKCKSCGLNKKSPGCCKLTATSAKLSCGTCPSKKTKSACGGCPSAAKPKAKSCCGVCK